MKRVPTKMDAERFTQRGEDNDPLDYRQEPLTLEEHDRLMTALNEAFRVANEMGVRMYVTTSPPPHKRPRRVR